MRLPKRDIIATGAVAVAAFLYLLWVLDATLPSLSGTRATGIVVLGLGFAASASAVVPGFAGLLHGNKAYLAVTSLIGLGACVAGVWMLVTASDVALALVMAAMVVLWLISTIHHSMIAGTATHPAPQDSRPETSHRATV